MSHQSIVFETAASAGVQIGSVRLCDRHLRTQHPPQLGEERVPADRVTQMLMRAQAGWIRSADSSVGSLDHLEAGGS